MGDHDPRRRFSTKDGSEQARGARCAVRVPGRARHVVDPWRVPIHHPGSRHFQLFGGERIIISRIRDGGFLLFICVVGVVARVIPVHALEGNEPRTPRHHRRLCVVWGKRDISVSSRLPTKDIRSHFWKKPRDRHSHQSPHIFRYIYGLGGRHSVSGIRAAIFGGTGTNRVQRKIDSGIQRELQTYA